MANDCVAVVASICRAGKHLSDRHKFRPNPRPIVRAKHLPGNLIARLALDLHAKLGACFSTAGQDLVEVGVIDPALLCKDRALLRCQVHGHTSYSETLQLVKAFCYRLSEAVRYKAILTSLRLR